MPLSSEAFDTTEEKVSGATHCNDAFADKGETETGKLIKKGLV